VALVTNVDFYIVSFRISLGKSGWTWVSMNLILVA
jgi:hypothetical protein